MSPLTATPVTGPKTSGTCLAEGERHYDALEQQLAAGPVITVPTITLEGDANGAPHPDSSAYANKFAGRFRSSRRPLWGHDLEGYEPNFGCPKIFPL
jgi:hypothetical protein